MNPLSPYIKKYLKENNIDVPIMRVGPKGQETEIALYGGQVLLMQLPAFQRPQLSMNELRKLARERGINSKGMKKLDLIQALFAPPEANQ